MEAELARDLREGTYAPKPVRQVLIPKKQSRKFRPLGIPLRDRVSAASAVSRSWTRWEQYGYPGVPTTRSNACMDSGKEVVDGDLSGEIRMHQEPTGGCSAHQAGDAGGGGRREGRRREPRAAEGDSARSPDLTLAQQPLHAALHAGMQGAGLCRRFCAEIVNYADDFRVLGKAGGRDADGGPAHGGPEAGHERKTCACPSFPGPTSEPPRRPWEHLHKIAGLARIHPELHLPGNDGWANYSAWGRSARPTTRSTDTPSSGCVRHKVRSGGYVRFSDERPGKPWSHLPCVKPHRAKATLAEMRENRTSGLTSALYTGECDQSNSLGGRASRLHRLHHGPKRADALKRGGSPILRASGSGICGRRGRLIGARVALAVRARSAHRRKDGRDPLLSFQTTLPTAHAARHPSCDRQEQPLAPDL